MDMRKLIPGYPQNWPQQLWASRVGSHLVIPLPRDSGSSLFPTIADSRCLQSLIEGYNEHDLDERVSGKSHDMTMISLCEQYQEALGRKDLGFVLGLFADDAVIRAPVSGTANVRDFHTYIFSNTKRTAMRFPNVIRRRAAPPAITMQFSYTLAIKGGQIIVIDGVANFEIDEHATKFKSLSFVYDPAEVRQLMAEAGIAPPDHPPPVFAHRLA